MSSSKNPKTGCANEPSKPSERALRAARAVVLEYQPPNIHAGSLRYDECVRDVATIINREMAPAPLQSERRYKEGSYRDRTPMTTQPLRSSDAGAAPPQPATCPTCKSIDNETRLCKYRRTVREPDGLEYEISDSHSECVACTDPWHSPAPAVPPAHQYVVSHDELSEVMRAKAREQAVPPATTTQVNENEGRGELRAIGAESTPASTVLTDTGPREVDVVKVPPLSNERPSESPAPQSAEEFFFAHVGDHRWDVPGEWSNGQVFTFAEAYHQSASRELRERLETARLGKELFKVKLERSEALRDELAAGLREAFDDIGGWRKRAESLLSRVETK